MHICSHSNKCLIPHPHTYSRVARLTVSVAHDDDDDHDDCKRDASSKVCSLAWMCRIVVLHCRHRLNYKLLRNRFFYRKEEKREQQQQTSKKRTGVSCDSIFPFINARLGCFCVYLG